MIFMINYTFFYLKYVFMLISSASKTEICGRFTYLWMYIFYKTHLHQGFYLQN